MHKEAETLVTRGTRGKDDQPIWQETGVCQACPQTKTGKDIKGEN